MTALRATLFATVTFVFVLLPGCGGEGEVRVAAASSLATVLPKLQGPMEAACGVKVSVVYGSSGQLRAQIEAGAPFALFLSADGENPEALERGGRVAEGGLAVFAYGRLAIVTREGLPPVTTIQGIIGGNVRRYAIANPELAPYGRAADEAIDRSVSQNLIVQRVVAENVRQALEYVRSGDVDVALTAEGLVMGSTDLAWSPVDPALHAPIVHSAAIVAGTRDEEAARCFLRQLLGSDAQAVLAANGYGAVAR